MPYMFSWKEPWSLQWKSHKVKGHRYEAGLDRMVLFYENGSIMEIPAWSKCRVKLGTDWALAVKQAMEKESGQSVPVDANLSNPR